MTGMRMLGDYPYDPVRVACRRCDWRGQYRRSSLIALYGENAALPYVLRQLVQDCPKRYRFGNEACGAYFPDLLERPQPRGR
ncbi:MAG TPA: hypothetical protein VM713_10420 [Steroidobacteraceae bacterium]|nr:hypothetical protein [Steroidobacteraceae bacterium]